MLTWFENQLGDEECGFRKIMRCLRCSLDKNNLIKILGERKKKYLPLHRNKSFEKVDWSSMWRVLQLYGKQKTLVEEVQSRKRREWAVCCTSDGELLEKVDQSILKWLGDREDEGLGIYKTKIQKKVESVRRIGRSKLKWCEEIKNLKTGCSEWNIPFHIVHIVMELKNSSPEVKYRHFLHE